MESMIGIAPLLERVSLGIADLDDASRVIRPV